MKKLPFTLVKGHLAAHHTRQFFQRRPRRLSGLRGLSNSRLHQILNYMQEEVVFILVVQINSRFGHAGALSNLLQRGLLVASLGKDRLRHPSNGRLHKGAEHRLLRLAHALLDLDHAFSLPRTVPVMLSSVYVKEAMVTSWRWVPRQDRTGSTRDSGLQNFTCSTNSSNRALVCLMG